jgi:hypothetical protein
MRLFSTKERDAVADTQGKEMDGIKKESGDIEAALAAPVTQEIDPVIEKRVRRKLDMHIVPLLSALYLLAFLDRSNIGYTVPTLQ